MGLEVSVCGMIEIGEGCGEENKFFSMKKDGIWGKRLAWAWLYSLMQSAHEWLVNVICAWALTAGVGTPVGQIFQSTFMIA